MKPCTMVLLMAVCLAPLVLAHAQAATETVPEKRTSLPPDIDPQSRNRLPLVQRDKMDDAGKAAYDAVTDPKSRLKAELIGPAGIWLHIPELSPHIREINWHLRNKTKLDARLSELVILVAARENDGQTEWTSHEAAAKKAGLAQETIDTIKYRKPIDALPADEKVIAAMGRELLQEKRLTSATYAAAVQTFGQKAVIDIVMLMANYTMTSVILHAFDQQLRPDLTPSLPVRAH